MMVPSSDASPAARSRTLGAELERSARSRTLGAELERDRLKHRVGRVTVAVTALHRIAGEHRRELGATPRHLRRAIADFEAQIEAMDARLRDLALEISA